MEVNLNKKLGTVLVFADNISPDQAREILRRMMSSGFLDPKYYVSGLPQVHEFDPDLGGPVWYIP